MYSVHQLAAMQAHQAEVAGMGEMEELRGFKQVIRQAYRQSKYCDITIKTKDGTSVKAHKLILATQNKFFMRKLEKESEDIKELELTEVKGEAVKMVIDFIYSRKVRAGSVNKDNAKDIMKAGEVFNIEDIREEAAIFIAKHIDKDNAVDVMTKDVFAGAISNNAFVYVANNFQLFLSEEHLKKRLLSELNVSQVCHLLSQKNLMLWDTKTGLYLPALEREKQLFFFVMAYVAHDKETRLPELRRLLTCLKLPLLVMTQALSVIIMGEGLKEKPEELSGILSEILEPFENLKGSENLSTLFANDKKRSQSERRLLADTCKMRYATIPHSTSCSDLVPHGQPWAEKNMFCPAIGDKKVIHSTKQVIRSVTVFTANLSVEEETENKEETEDNKNKEEAKDKEKTDDKNTKNSKKNKEDKEDDKTTQECEEESKKNKEETEENKVDRRLVGIRLTWDDGETGEVGMTEHKTIKQQTYSLSEGEFITGVGTYHAQKLMSKNFLKEITSLTSIHDMSFETNLERTLGPMDDPPVPLSPGLRLKLPSKIRHLEKNCPGKFSWLQGFGSEEIKFGSNGTKNKVTFFPVWGFQTHFKVYSVKNQEFEFVAGIKKLYQFSFDGLAENTKIDDLDDILQVERSPVHEVVDLEDSESNSETEGSDAGTQMGMVPQDDSIMLVDSDSGEEDEEEESEEDDTFNKFGFPPQLPFRSGPINGKGGEDEPIEIESSSDEEEENSKEEKDKSAKKADKKKNGEGESTKDKENNEPDEGMDSESLVSEKKDKNTQRVVERIENENVDNDADDIDGEGDNVGENVRPKRKKADSTVDNVKEKTPKRNKK